MNDNIMTQMGFGKEVEDVHNSICPACKNAVDPNSFRDDVSRREYKISGLCQTCQDEIFGSDEEIEDEYQDDMYNPENTDFYDDSEEDNNEYPEEPEDFRDNDIYDASKEDDNYQDE